MPVSLTVTGTEGILASLDNLSNKVKGPELVQILGQEASIIIAQEAPVGERGMTRGLLQRTLSEMGPVTSTGDGWHVGVGNMEGILPPPDPPKGTIKRFLEIIRGSKKKTTRKRKVGTHFNPRHAWFYLSEEEKKLLRLMRETNREGVGGSSPYRPLYWHIQTTRGPHTGYVTRAIERIRSSIASTVHKVLVSRGPVSLGR